MKRILAGFVSAMLIFTATEVTVTETNKVYAFTVESDAQTAMEKNQENVLKALEDMDATNDITKDDLQSWIMSQCNYSSDKTYGAGVMVENFRLTRATENKSGLFTADVLIYQDDGEVGFEIRKEIPALGGGKSNDTEISDNESTTADSGEKEEAEDLGENFDYKTAFREAKTAISGAMNDFEFSNSITTEEAVKIAKNALPKGSKVVVTIKDDDFSLIKASTTLNGTVSLTITLTLGTQQERFPFAKTIQPVVTENSTKIDEDRTAISKALSNVEYSNKVTKESLFKVAESAVKNGSKISWMDNFYKKEATFEEDGIVYGYISMSFGEEKREVWVNEKIPMLVRKMPSNELSLNKEEWEILRMVNVERAKDGHSLLTMVDELQTACDIREPEILESASHTRPNGSKCYTAISDFNYTTAAENIYHCPSTSTIVPVANAMDGWMNSPGHRKNILTDGYDYIGIGSYEENREGSAVQFFAGWANPITEITTSSGSTNFEDEDAMQKEYLICTTSDGIVSYMPLDVSYMKKNGNSYTLNMNTTNPITLTVGDGKSTDSAEENGNAQKPNTAFTDVEAGVYYEDAVKWAVEKNVTTGTTATTFSPDVTCTRAQILTFMWRAAGSPEPTIANPFADVKDTDYYCKPALWAYEKGMVTGTEFEADTPCTRASTVTYMWQNAGAPKTNVSDKFSDVSALSDCAEAVAWATENGVTSGTSGTTFSPGLICSRAQIVTFLLRAVNILK